MSVSQFEPITKERAAAILGVSIRTIENHVRDKVMPAPVPLGGRVFWHPDIFFQWLHDALRSKSVTPTGTSEEPDDSLHGTTDDVHEPTPRSPGRKPGPARSSGERAVDAQSARSKARLLKLQRSN
jgi:hypothetical protein